MSNQPATELSVLHDNLLSGGCTCYSKQESYRRKNRFQPISVPLRRQFGSLGGSFRAGMMAVVNAPQPFRGHTCV